MTNPYKPPALPPDDSTGLPILRGVCPPGLRPAMRLGGLAAAVSAVCITVFFNICHATYGNDMAKMPFFVHQLRGASFYVAGIILAVGFGRKAVWPASFDRRLLLLSAGGYGCLLGAELLTLTLHGVLLSQSEGIFANIALRSAFPHRVTLSVFKGSNPLAETNSGSDRGRAIVVFSHGNAGHD